MKLSIQKIALLISIATGSTAFSMDNTRQKRDRNENEQASPDKQFLTALTEEFDEQINFKKLIINFSLQKKKSKALREIGFSLLFPIIEAAETDGWLTASTFNEQHFNTVPKNLISNLPKKLQNYTAFKEAILLAFPEDIPRPNFQTIAQKMVEFGAELLQEYTEKHKSQQMQLASLLSKNNINPSTADSNKKKT